MSGTISHEAVLEVCARGILAEAGVQRLESGRGREDPSAAGAGPGGQRT